MPASAYLALTRVAAGAPDATALVFEDEAWTFAAFVAAVDATAQQLGRDGIARGDIFGVLAPNCPEILFAYYAAARIGAVIVPINPALSAEETAYAIEHSEQKRLYLHPDLKDRVSDPAHQARVRPLTRLGGHRAPTPLPAPHVPGPDDDFLLCYTSGSTGEPKGVMLTHAGQVAAPRALAQMWGVGPGDTVLVALPLGFLYGLSTGCAMALQAGATVALERRFHPGDVLNALGARGADVYQGVPTMFSMMLEYCEQQGRSFDLASMTALVSAGAPLSPELAQRFGARFGKEIQNYYAMTEVTPIFGIYRGDADPVPEGAVGKAAPMADIRIRRPDGAECEIGEEGEFFVRGASIFARYEKADDLTREVMQGGYFRSGDLGKRDARGFYSITGRLKDLIIRGGINIAPAELEAVLGAHPGVQDVAVVGGPDRMFGEVPVAFVVRRAGQNVSADELQAFAATRLADFKVPRAFCFQATLPLGKTGKVDKAALGARVRRAQG